MGLDKRFRTYTEKTTSIEQPIEVVQYGRFVTRISSSGAGTLALILPTTVPNVKSLKLTPLTASASRVKDYYCDLNLYTASHPLVSSALSRNRTTGTNNIGASDIDETVFSFDKQTTNSKWLYESQKAAKATLLANYHPAGGSGAQASAGTYWKKNLTIASNGKNYLKVLIKNTASAGASKVMLRKCIFAYEVRGYE